MAEKTRSTRSNAKTTTAKATITPIAAPTTRTTRARTAAGASTPTQDPPPALPKKAATRKPAAAKDKDEAPKKRAAPKKATAAKAKATESSDHREPIMTYLRIRPYAGTDASLPDPYLTTLDDRTVRMTEPAMEPNPSRQRLSMVSPSSTYTFSHIFPGTSTQSEFFQRTTLPLVQDVLEGQNALLFAYGTTNSGKTYTVQGGPQEGSAGILPRTLDVIFNSIKGLHSEGKYRPVRLQGVEPDDASESRFPSVDLGSGLANVFGPEEQHVPSDDIDDTVLKLDRNYEYSVYLSYAEIYNEKVYDLLASAQDEDGEKPSGIPRPGNDKTLLLTRQALALKPSPPSDGIDSNVRGKYIGGLRQFRVRDSNQAKALVKVGQFHRKVFGTLANRVSSRSHAMVIIKILRGHRGEKDDPTSLQVSRLTLVDLAGSERSKNTHTTGERLKEAGNINKSLMVLGQCMETMRSNQRKLASSLSQETTGSDSRVDTRDVKKTLAVVPFRHSKLTESLMDYFVGDGRAVMIVNVNPYDTGYDENSHVMKFAALTREVYVTPAPAPIHQPGPGKLTGKTIKTLGPMTLSGHDMAPRPNATRKVTIPGTGKRATNTVLEVVEVDEEEEDSAQADDDDPINPLIDELFDEVESLRMQLYESEMRCAVMAIEAETQEEIIRDLRERQREMEIRHNRRLRQETEFSEAKTDAKIDLLHQSGLLGSPVKRPVRPPSLVDSDEEDEDEDEEPIDDGSESGEEFNFEGIEDTTESERSPSPSPMPARRKSAQPRSSVSPTKIVVEPREFISSGPVLPSDSEDAEMSEGTVSEDESQDGEESQEDTESEYDDEELASEEESEYEPASAPPRTPRASPKKPVENKTPKPNSMAKLGQDIQNMSLGESDSDEAVDVQSLQTTVKKKKRVLGKASVITEDQVERMSAL